MSILDAIANQVAHPTGADLARAAAYPSAIGRASAPADVAAADAWDADAAPIAALQLERLRRTIKWATDKSPFYRRKLGGLTLPEINSLADLRAYPFTLPKELDDPLDLLTLPLSGVARVSLREQNQPPPLIHMYTVNDLRVSVEVLSRVLEAAKITRASIVGVLGDPADGGLLNAIHAVELLGATSIPLGVNFEHIQRLLDMFRMHAIIGSARQVLRLAIQLQAVGKDIAEYAFQEVLCLNEALRNPLEMHLENRTGARVYNLYSSPTFGCIGMVFQCSAHIGLHLQEDHFYPEVIKFGSDEPTERNCTGELVLTTLSAEAMPMIRVRTGQAVLRLDGMQCPCGSPLMRIEVPN